jgi:hypothetical protein
MGQVDTKTYDYLLVGKMVYCYCNFDGTSNGTSFTFDLPENITTSPCWFNVASAYDSGVFDATVYGRSTGNPGTGNTVSFFKNNSSTGWTASGRKAAQFEFHYRRA